ncbi:GumC family protein [Acidicapsa ligni]|uniref:GumC family protein n=1 Tax=Acidicapsa ligni TaxID=542300 RepID=UPI0021E0CE2E|nr:Wzz/FepE/Etk N-terminal domain-containing protein [Acidicapsa ligni]
MENFISHKNDPVVADAPPSAAWARNLLYLWQRRKTLLRIGIVAFILSTVIAFTIPKRYKSTTNIMPPEQQGSGTALLAALAGRAGGGAGSLGMLASGLLGAKGNGDLYIDLLRSGTVTGSLAERFHLQQIYKKRYMKDTLKKLSSNTQITESKKSGVITIVVTDTDRQRAQDLARGYVEELNKVLARVSTSSARRERQFVEQRQAAVLKELDDAEEQLSQFSSSTSTIDIREQTRATVDAGAKLQAQMIFGESELESLKQIYGDNNVRVKAASERIGVLQRELGKIGGSSDTTNAPLALSKDELYPPLRRLPELGVRYANLFRRVKVQETVYELLSAEYETARIQEAKEIPTVSTIDSAGWPEKKSFPPRLIFMLAGTLIVLLFASFVMLYLRNWHELDESDDLKKLVRIFKSRNATSHSDGAHV